MRKIISSVIALVVMGYVSFAQETAKKTQKTKQKQNQVVAHAFLAQNKIGCGVHLTADGNVVVSPYALQDWICGEGGGEAILKYVAPKGWTLIKESGGAWDVEGLVSDGVPRSYAEQLVAERGW